MPNRILWDHWKELHGENNDSAWKQEIEYEVPQITTDGDGWEIGTIADYFGIPTGVGGLSVNALPFRAYSHFLSEPPTQFITFTISLSLSIILEP